MNAPADDVRFDLALDGLESAVREFTRNRGLPLSVTTRKNVTRLTVADRITVELGGIDRGLDAAYVAVTDPATAMRMECRFPGFPTRAGLLGLLTGQLSEAD
ncbi:hypothetical protein [Nocardia brasiliensis]|uniref:hypothetical protein n=1 Tax=Nocardia brasiliensis TaxID=37326 RepID=UPI002454AA91|nr:hypothetical protein [Nocardia brasiliensis]